MLIDFTSPMSIHCGGAKEAKERKEFLTSTRVFRDEKKDAVLILFSFTGPFFTLLSTCQLNLQALGTVLGAPFS